MSTAAEPCRWEVKAGAQSWGQPQLPCHWPVHRVAEFAAETHFRALGSKVYPQGGLEVIVRHEGSVTRHVVTMRPRFSSRRTP